MFLKTMWKMQHFLFKSKCCNPTMFLALSAPRVMPHKSEIAKRAVPDQPTPFKGGGRSGSSPFSI